jgi:hypothetical protein
MIVFSKDTLSLLREWTKASNATHSEKIRSIFWFLVDGKDEKIKARILYGNNIHNYNVANRSGLLVQYNNHLAIFQSILNQKDSYNFKTNKVDFYQIFVKREEKGNKIIPTYAAKHLGPYPIEKVVNIFSEYLANIQGINGLNGNINTVPEDGSVETINTKCIEEFNKLIYFNTNEGPIEADYLVCRTRLEYESKDESLKGTSFEKNDVITWNFLGEDKSKCAINYKIMQEFEILPYEIDLGKVVEIR